MAPTPFPIRIAQDRLDDLRARLLKTRLPDQIEDAGWTQGTERGRLEEIVHYWANGFDWRLQEARLNRLPHFRQTLGDHDIHFVHVRAGNGRGVPILLTHGWPGAFTEFLQMIPLLTEPGASPDGPLFDVVIPSLPGYGFSSRPRKAGTNPRAIAALWAELMSSLGYDRFLAQGGDWGAAVTTWLARDFPERLLGAHLNYVPGSFEPSYQPEELSAAERAFIAAKAAWGDEEGGYGQIQRTRPQTLAYALNDSPAGLAAWLLEKFRAWSDGEGAPADGPISPDDILTIVSVYWFTATIGSSMRLYWEARREPLRFGPGETIEVPLAVARFPKELPTPPREWVERVFTNLRRWTPMPRGGHFAALEQPQLLADDLRAFTRELSQR